MECEVLDCCHPKLSLDTPLSPGRGGARAGAAGVRDVCGPDRERYAMSALRLFHNIEAELKKRKARTVSLGLGLGFGFGLGFGLEERVRVRVCCLDFF